MDESSRSLIVKRKKNKNPAGAQAFFSRILNFFEFFFCEMAGAGKFWGFGAVCRLADSVVFGILRRFSKRSERA